MVERLPMSNSNSIILFDDDKEATTADKNWMRFERERERRNELTLCVQTTALTRCCCRCRLMCVVVCVEEFLFSFPFIIL